MPRYFFNIQDGRNINDDTGMELPDIYAAQHEAIKLSGELLREMGDGFWNETEWILRVCENNAVLFGLRFSAEERNVVSR